MATTSPDAITEFEILSKKIEEAMGITKHSLDAYAIYLELIAIREQLAKIERSFPKARN